jgi:hypothetical protein
MSQDMNAFLIQKERVGSYLLANWVIPVGNNGGAWILYDSEETSIETWCVLYEPQYGELYQPYYRTNSICRIWTERGTPRGSVIIQESIIEDISPKEWEEDLFHLPARIHMCMQKSLAIAKESIKKG